MSLVAHYSAPWATSGASTPSTPNASLGGYLASNAVPDMDMRNVFDDISGTENAARTVDYRCLFVYNPTAQAALADVILAGRPEAEVLVGLDPTPASVATATTAQALVIADELQEPGGVSFSASVHVGTLDPGYCRAVWLKRTAPHSSSRIEGDSVIFEVFGWWI